MVRTSALMLFIVGGILSSDVSRAQDKKPPAKDEPKLPVTVTAGGVTYVVTKSAIAADGKKWMLTIEATSKGTDEKILIASARAVTPEGKTFEIKSLMGRKETALPEDTKILIELNMGDLPKDVGSLARIELFGDRRIGIPGYRIAPPKAFSGKKPEEIRPLVLKNVPIERAEK